MNPKTEIREFRKNIMGTISFHMKTPKMRKFQEFIVYPKHAGDVDQSLKIQSDTRIGIINTITGEIKLSQSHPCGAYAPHLVIDSMDLFRLEENFLKSLKLAVLGTIGDKVGLSVVFTDNSSVVSIY